MKHIAQKYGVILLLVLLCSLSLFVQLDAQAYHALPMPGYSGGMVFPVFSPFSSGLFGAPYSGLFPLFRTLSGVASIYGQGIVFPGFDQDTIVASIDGSIQANPGGGGIIQANPGGNIQSPEWNYNGLSASPYGSGDPLVPMGAFGFPYFGLQYPAIGFFGMGFPGIGLPGLGFSGIGLSGLGIPGIGFPGISFLGTGIPGMGFPGTGFSNIEFSGMGPIVTPLPVTGVPWMWNPWASFPLTGFPVPGDQGTYYQQPPDMPDNSLVTLLGPLGNLLQKFSIEELPAHISNLISMLPVIPSVDLPIPQVDLPVLPVDLPIQLASITSRMYVAATIKGTTQSIYILLEDDDVNNDDKGDDDLILSFEDIKNEGKYCIKVKNLPGVETSYKVECGENCYTVSLYWEISSCYFIWAWDVKPW